MLSLVRGGVNPLWKVHASTVRRKFHRLRWQSPVPLSQNANPRAGPAYSPRRQAQRGLPMTERALTPDTQPYPTRSKMIDAYLADIAWKLATAQIGEAKKLAVRLPHMGAAL